MVLEKNTFKEKERKQSMDKFTQAVQATMDKIRAKAKDRKMPIIVEYNGVEIKPNYSRRCGMRSELVEKYNKEHLTTVATITVTSDDNCVCEVRVDTRFAKHEPEYSEKLAVNALDMIGRLRAIRGKRRGVIKGLVGAPEVAM